VLEGVLLTFFLMETSAFVHGCPLVILFYFWWCSFVEATVIL